MQLSQSVVSKLLTQPSVREGKIFPTYSLFETSHVITPGQHIRLKFLNRLQCTACARPVKKLFDGFCYPCLTHLAKADRCITSPHLCHFKAGTCREPQWAQGFCFTPHVVYLAFTDKFKVGITRESHLPGRWIDQGATMATPLVKTHDRFTAGAIEKWSTQFIPDKTAWSTMLKSGNKRPTFSEFIEKTNDLKKILLENSLNIKETYSLIGSSFEILQSGDFGIHEIEYPIEQIPEKVTSHSLDKNTTFEGKLCGIKGQYLMTDKGCLNMRRHEGYWVEWELSEAPFFAQ